MSAYHPADQLELVRMIFAARMRLADVDHIGIRNPIPELRLLYLPLTAQQKIAKSSGRRKSREKAQKTQK
jgi:hypothetical protein